eukprot:CAMPEP_0174705804 /NCGR_PEP_ID=MMETSP1094-20130205/8888_1 /TAXON_ID=156173 /ORGANISM="Chrysochromulina brevifilum, Strain UTEX LB 985" /LENGTH=157 /DNA_ID=CAMNT_0015904007 /DNA_START=273 /DNA_END=746 /DNA_ORIENTATION=+
MPWVLLQAVATYWPAGSIAERNGVFPGLILSAAETLILRSRSKRALSILRTHIYSTSESLGASTTSCIWRGLAKCADARGALLAQYSLSLRAPGVSSLMTSSISRSSEFALLECNAARAAAAPRRAARRPGGASRRARAPDSGVAFTSDTRRSAVQT